MRVIKHSSSAFSIQCTVLNKNWLFPGLSQGLLQILLHIGSENPATELVGLLIQVFSLIAV